MPYLPPDPNRGVAHRSREAAVVPADFTESAAASAVAFMNTDMSISRPLMVSRVHEEVMDAYRDATGRSFTWRNERGYLSESAPMRERSSRRFWEAMAAEMEANPKLRESLPVLSIDEVDRRMQEIAAAGQFQLRETQARATGMGVAGSIFGEVAAAIVDPPVALSLFVGAPVAAARASILKASMIEAGIGAASEIPVQVLAQPFRQEVGLEGGFAQGAQNVAMASLGGAAIYGLAALGARRFRGPRQQEALELAKQQHVESTAPPDGRMSAAEHRASMDQAIFDIQEGRAVNVQSAPELAGSQYVVDIETIGQRLASVERQGAPISDLVPNLGRAIELAQSGARIVMSRDRVDGLARAAITARQAVRPLYQQAADAEAAIADILQRQSDNTTAQIRNELARGGRANAERTLTRATRQRLAEIEDQLKSVTDSDKRALLNTERRKIVDAARKRVEREGERLTEEARQLEIEAVAAQARKNKADADLTRAEQDIAQADATIAREIGGALTDRDVRRLYERRA